MAFVLGIAPLPSVRASERECTLEAIHQLENPMDSPRPGSCGELGPYQFRERTWRMHTQEPFLKALDRNTSEEVAIRHYEWIKAELSRRGLDPSPYNIALVWNGGLRAATGSAAPSAARDYARRAANLSEYFQRAGSGREAHEALADAR